MTIRSAVIDSTGNWTVIAPAPCFDCNRRARS